MHETQSAAGVGMHHSAHHVASHGGPPSSPAQHHAQQCTCPSECGGSGGRGILASAPIEPFASSSIETDAAAWRVTASAQARAEFLTPFANGPPAIS